jgi:predicted dehydrogenase
MSKETYRAAVCGLGKIAWRFDQRRTIPDAALTHVGAYSACDRVVLVGGCSPSEIDRKDFRKSWDVPVFVSVEEMVDTIKPDIVSICSPPAFHVENASYCAENGVSMIWLEKPPAGSLQDLDRLITIAARDRTTVLVNYLRRYDPAYDWLRQCLRRGEFGMCHRIDIHYSRGLEENGSHMLDMLLYLLDSGKTVSLQWVSSGHDKSPSLILSQEGGPVAIIAGANLPYHDIDVRLTCDKGRFSVLKDGAFCVVERAIENETYPGFFLLGESESVCIDKEPAGHMVCALNDLITSFEKGLMPRSTLITARPTVAIIDQVRSWKVEEVIKHRES